MSEALDLSKEVEALAKKAVGEPDAGEAMKFAQAACNVANAMACINNITRANK